MSVQQTQYSVDKCFRYLDVIDVTSWPRVRSGYWQAALVFAAAALVNAPKWFEFRYTYIPDNTSHLLANAEGEGKMKYKVLLLLG